MYDEEYEPEYFEVTDYDDSIAAFTANFTIRENRRQIRKIIIEPGILVHGQMTERFCARRGGDHLVQQISDCTGNFQVL